MAGEEEEERILIVPLKDIRKVPRTKRAPHAIKLLKKHVARHMKGEIEDVWIDDILNEFIWSRGIEKPPTKIKVKAYKWEDGRLEVTLPEED
jgi:large subunit ribosomal protein L31e